MFFGLHCHISRRGSSQNFVHSLNLFIISRRCHMGYGIINILREMILVLIDKSFTYYTRAFYPNRHTDNNSVIVFQPNITFDRDCRV